MLKTRTLTLTAVVAVGAIALGAPTLAGANPGPASPASISDQIAKLKQAGKSAKSRAHTSSKWSKGIDKSVDRTNTAITRLGNNVYDLRKANDMTNWTLSSIASAAISALTQLQAGLVGLAASYTNFEYGVAAMTSGGTPIAGAMLVTPRIDPTSEPSTVTGQFVCIADNGCAQGGALGIQTVVRSVNPATNASATTAACTVTATQAIKTNETAGAYAVIGSPESASASIPGAGTLGAGATTYWPVTRVPLPAADPTEKTQQPFTMVASEFSQATNLMAAGKASTAGLSGLGLFRTGVSRDLTGLLAGLFATGGSFKVTLSCLAVPV